MQNNFCKALIESDRKGLQKLTDEYLGTLDAKASKQDNFEAIKKWISGFECVASVEYKVELLDSDPPVKIFIVNVKGFAQPTSIGISLYEDRWKFDRK